jgi:hypothetical protein
MFSVAIIENPDLDNEIEYYSELQKAINSGSAWSLQGSYGRAMMAAIEAGACMLGREPARDYWGTRIPSRDEVKAGTKGSFDFVARRNGQDWADLVGEVA